jgi:uncharacterized protein YdeI (YjbR/CyaY-like superfamily)
MLKKTTNLPHKKLPQDIANFLFENKEAKKTFESTTDLARNEWICLLTSAKTEKGKMQRLARAKDQLSRRQKRPCCWAGCPHRKTILQ